MPDGDTGTNMAFTFKAILDAVEKAEDAPLDRVLGALTEAALDGARGNSGAIMAQFFQGCREAAGDHARLDARALARACRRGADQAWTAMARPVAGTLPTVLEDFAAALESAVRDDRHELRALLEYGLAAARESLAGTPRQLAVLRQAGVVDAGGQAFVDLLEGIHAFVFAGRLDPLDSGLEDEGALPDLEAFDAGPHRFCTECVIEGQALDRQAVMQRLRGLDQSSLVVAGGSRRLRVHAHLNEPGELFLACEAFGEITQQKADDMQRQHGLLNQPGRVAVVTDSGADLPASEVERLGIHVVPVRLSFGEQEFLDGVTLDAAGFYRMLEEHPEFPRTSQPPARDFRRVYELLTGHGYDVLSVGLSSRLSGTLQAARSAAARVSQGQVRVVDTLSASCGQGLLAMVAADAAAAGRSLEDLVALLEGLVPRTVILAMPDELRSAVRGGRVPAWVGRLAAWLRVTPVMTAREGRMAIAGIVPGTRVSPARLARRALRRMQRGTTYRVLVAHAANPEGARDLRRLLLAGHPQIHSCHLAEAGPALGVHFGKRGLIVGFLPHGAD